MKKILIVAGSLLLIGLVICAIFIYYFMGSMVGGGGSTQYAPDTVQTGEPAIVTMVFTATGGGGPIKGRLENISLHYRLVGEDVYQTTLPQLIPLPDNYQSVQTKTFQSEAYEFTILPYPEGTSGEIEYYIELTFDGYASKQEGVKKIQLISILPTESTAELLGAPTAILAYDNKVALSLTWRECDKSYRVERSYNQRDWQVVGTAFFSTYQEPYDHNFRACEHDFMDTQIASGTKKLWYRYGLLDDKENVLTWSTIGEVIMEEY